MLLDSFFIRIISAFFRKLRLYYEISVLCKMVAAVTGAIMGVWHESFICRLLFDDMGLECTFEAGITGRLKDVTKFFGRTSSKCGDTVLNSGIVSLFHRIMSNLLYFSSAVYGVFALCFGIAVIGFWALGRTGNMLFYGAALLVASGIVLIIINRPLSRLFNGSSLLRAIGGFFAENVENGDARDGFEKGGYAFFGTLGAAFGCAAGLLPPTFFLMAFAGFFGALLVLYKAEAGVFALLFFIPILPTKYILALAVLTVFSYFFKVVFTGGQKLKISLMDFWVIGFLAVLLYSVAVSYMPKNSLIVAATYALFILCYFAVRNVVNTRQKLYAAVALVCLSGLLVSLYGLYQKYTGAYISTEAWLDTTVFEDLTDRVYSTLDNPNVLGEYLLFVIPLAFCGLYYMKKPLYKCASLVILSAAAVCLMLTLSRGAWLGLLFGMLVFVLIKDRRLLWLGLIALLIVPFVMPPSYMERFMSIGNMTDGSTSYRVNIWLASLKMLSVFWPVGIGLSTNVFVFVYQKFAFNAVYAPHSHNLYLQIMLDLGIVGFLLFVFIMFAFYKNLLKRTEAKSDSRHISSVSAALCAGMTGYLVQGMTDNVFYNYRVTLFFWVIVALSGSISAMKEMESE